MKYSQLVPNAVNYTHVTISLFCLIVERKYEPTQFGEFVIIRVDSIVVHCYHGRGDDNLGENTGVPDEYNNLRIFEKQ